MNIPHNRPFLGRKERNAADAVLASGWVAQEREVERFEDALCAFLKLPPGHAVAVSSGSAALFLALHVLGAKNQRVALPVYACAALSNAVALAGASPFFLDVAEDGPNVAPEAIAKSGADIAVAAHMWGVPIDLRGVGKARIIEDCAQSLGARVAGTPVGVQATVGIFSFYATKLITSGGQGGMLVSRDRALVDAARDYRAFDQRRDRLPRFNFQMTDVQAAIGRVQLARLPQFLARREEIFQRYLAVGLPLYRTAANDLTAVRYRAVLRTNTPPEMIAFLATSGITAIVPVEEWELLDTPVNHPHARALAQSTVSLPIHPGMTDAEVDRVIEAMRGPQ